ncbi:YafY family transcriptional regulator [Neisseriaceae bacterium TC5R-5]|nr:YafY family transcriptional regulator [Neisseriaceae bacterium TC5R-5]
MQILLLMRGRRRTTARQLAEWLEVSLRTVYRDMADLMQSGTPINGEAGEGYWLEAGFNPPAASFSSRELAALEVGARMLTAWADHDTAQAAQSALARIHAVLGSTELPLEPLYAPPSAYYPRDRLTPLRDAILQRQALTVQYQDAQAQSSERILCPVALFFWGDRWVLAAWCALRAAYRSFRVDRLQSWQPCEQNYPEDISLDAYVRQHDCSQHVANWLQQNNRRAWHAES